MAVMPRQAFKSSLRSALLARSEAERGDDFEGSAADLAASGGGRAKNRLCRCAGMLRRGSSSSKGEHLFVVAVIVGDLVEPR